VVKGGKTSTGRSLNSILEKMGPNDVYVKGVNALDMETYLAIYYPSQTEKVLIGTMYPWDEGALQLLKTIHVKKINSTS
jgi:hypothetical protein